MSSNIRSRHLLREITMVGLFAALLAVSAWITIPAAVPFTMQTFAVFLILNLAGGKLGTIAITAYILLGAFGLPVFSGFKGGFGVLMGATGGYIMGFVATGLIYWLITSIRPGKLWIRVSAMAVGLIICYAFGTIWFVNMYSGPTSVGAALMSCVIPFIPFDILKIYLAG